MRNKQKDVVTLLIAVLACFCFVVSGCDDVDPGPKADSEVEVCNNDDDDYTVTLYDASDDSVVDSFEIDSILDISGDRCDKFRDLEAGDYYITIDEKGGSDTDTSDTFTLDGDDDMEFIIDSTGDIEKD